MTSQNLYRIIGQKIRPKELAWLVKRILFIRKKRLFLEQENKYFFTDPSGDLGIIIQRNEVYEKEIVDIIKSKLTPGDVFLDIGANEGFFSVIASDCVGKNGRVFCIEPQKVLMPIILENIRINHLLNITIFPFAVGEQNETKKMQTEPGNTAVGTLTNDFSTKVSAKKIRKFFYKKEIVEVTTIDDILENENEVRLIKLDIEGFELNALKGACKSLSSQKIQYFLIEIHPRSLSSLGQTPEEINHLLEAAGYKSDYISGSKEVSYHLIFSRV